MMEEQITKTCRLCGEVKPLTEYQTYRRSASCADCNRQKERERNKAAPPVTVVCPNCNRSRTVSKNYAYSARARCLRCAGYSGTAHISGKLYSHWRNMAKGTNRNRKAKEWNLTPADIEAQYVKQSGRCALTGRVMALKENEADRISLDRINSAKGYEVGNIQLTTAAANVAKNRLSVDELVKLAGDIVRTHSVPLPLWLEAVEAA